MNMRTKRKNERKVKNRRFFYDKDKEKADKKGSKRNFLVSSEPNEDYRTPQ